MGKLPVLQPMRLGSFLGDGGSCGPRSPRTISQVIVAPSISTSRPNFRSADAVLRCEVKLTQYRGP